MTESDSFDEFSQWRMNRQVSVVAVMCLSEKVTSIPHARFGVLGHKMTNDTKFALLKYVIFGHPRFLLRGLRGAQTEISLATLAYNLKTMMNVLGGARIAAALS